MSKDGDCRTHGHTARKTRIYDNIPVYSPEGELMFMTNLKRARWYGERGLAEDCREGIKLTFEPNGRGHYGDEYYTQILLNVCACCGSGMGLVRAHVVPLGLRRYFPANIKDHAHHDILPLCTSCLGTWEAAQQRFIRELTESHGVPSNGLPSLYAYEEGFELRVKAKMAASALKRFVAIPEPRKEVLRDFIRAAYPELDPGEPRTWDYALALPPPVVEKPGSVIVKLIAGENMDESAILRHLVMPLRALFVQTMKPRSLPQFWSITREKP